jgi:hypothetical protein
VDKDVPVRVVALELGQIEMKQSKDATCEIMVSIMNERFLPLQGGKTPVYRDPRTQGEPIYSIANYPLKVRQRRIIYTPTEHSRNASIAWGRRIQ